MTIAFCSKCNCSSEYNSKVEVMHPIYSFKHFSELECFVDQLECVGQMAGAKDLHHNFVYVNASYADFHGLPRDEIIGKKSGDMPNGINVLSPLMHEQDQMVLLQQKKIIMGSIHPHRNGGDPRAYKFRKFPALLNEKHPIILFTGEDLTCDTTFWSDVLWNIEPMVKVEKLVSASYSQQLESKDLGIPLSDNEWAVLSLLLRGIPTKRIASIYEVSIRTIENRIESLKDKFGALNQQNLLDMARRSGYQSVISRAIFKEHMTYNLLVE
ncbi:PAS domain-containing protein [Chromobacterium sp. IIBBL 290-4]|uniref:PAS domain-containing protein n=1 Tax=Chromobacterium sp. IIBBL 290-4 TaxID=2953890 RepID=UPI0020B66976|nr:PAS domain-containing protein [Chromobacterium sp. IIBBL 290-4]UTH75556.1 LuxR C-terminal-related transcriptional regulator [Chromobacterium sp. IIBBL 290-4]